MTEAEILAEWEARYGKLSAKHRSRFLEKGGHAKRLAKLPDDVVREAIVNRRRLDEIEALATGRGGGAEDLYHGSRTGTTASMER